MHNVIIDANVILSGILFGGNPAKLLDAIQKEKFVLCISDKLVDEVFDKLTNKFVVDKHILYKVSIILDNGMHFTPAIKIAFPQDPDDAYLLELAQAAQAHYLITGDKKHLLPLKVWKSTQIISPSQAVEIF